MTVRPLDIVDYLFTKVHSDDAMLATLFNTVEQRCVIAGDDSQKSVLSDRFLRVSVRSRSRLEGHVNSFHDFLD